MTDDPRGPVRKIVSVDWRTDVCLVSLDCGHIRPMNQIFHYKVGNDCRCFQCGPHGKAQEMK